MDTTTRPNTAIPLFLMAKTYRFRADDGSLINVINQEWQYMHRTKKIGTYRDHGIIMVSVEEQGRITSEPQSFKRRTGKFELI